MLSSRPAGAHATYSGSEPADGSVLAVAPKALTLRFGEDVTAAGGAATLRGVSGQASTSLVMTANGSSILVVLPPLTPDLYRIDWRVRDAFDLHPVSGTVAFAFVPPSVTGTERERLVGGASATYAPSEGPGPSWFEVTARAAALLGALVLGALLFVGRRHTRRLLLGRIAWVALSGGLGAQMVLQWNAIGSAVMSSPFAIVWCISVLAWIGFAVSDRPSSREVATSGRFAVGITAIAATATVMLGHGLASGIPAGVARAVHVASLAMWLACLAVVLATAIARRGEALQRFSRNAVYAAGLVLASGFALAARQVVTVDALLTTRYGRVLLVKLFLVAVVVVLGVIQARRQSRGLVLRVKAAALEVCVGAVVVVIAAFLGASAPANGPDFATPKSPPAPARVTEQAADLAVSATMTPNRPGTNFIDVDVLNTRRPAPAPFASVTISVRDASQSSLGPSAVATSQSDTRYSVADARIAASGDAVIHVEVVRAGFPRAVVDIPWTVSVVPRAVRPERFSRASLVPWWIGLAFLSIVGALLVKRRGRFSSLSTPHGHCSPSS